MTRKFRVLSIKPKSRWRARWRGWSHVVLSLVHDDPNDWQIFGQIRCDVEDSKLANVKVGDVVNVLFDAWKGD